MILGTNKTFAELLDFFEPRPIENDAQYWATQEVIDALLSKQLLSEDEHAYLHLLSLLLEAYDEEQDTVPELRGVELIRALLEESGLKQKDLIPIFKHESTVSSIFNGRRALTANHINELADFFSLPHHLFFEKETNASISVSFQMTPLGAAK